MNGWFESERRSLHRAATGKLRDFVAVRDVQPNGRLLLVDGYTINFVHYLLLGTLAPAKRGDVTVR